MVKSSEYLGGNGKMIATTERRGVALTTPGMVTRRRRSGDMAHDSAIPPSVPHGYCHCGCGHKTTIIKNTDRKRGRIKGEPNKFLYSHHVCREPYTPTDPYIDGDSVVIPLMCGIRPRPVALVDAADFELIASYKWALMKRPGGAWTAAARIEGRWVKLHRLVSSAPDGLVVDHADGDPLNNHRANLRIATQSDNALNTRKLRRGTPYSRFKGVYKDGGRWRARLTYKGEAFHAPSTFDNDEDAARAYDEILRSVNPDFGRYNFPQAGERPALREDPA